MPIYKISRRENAEKRARAKYVRIRLVALLTSGLFGLGTILLLLHGVGR